MNKKHRAYFFWTYILILVILAIAPWSTSHRVGIEGFKFRLDYFFHLFAYLGLTILYILWQFNSLFTKRFLVLVVHITLLITFSFLTEAVQLIISYRSFNIKDFIANTMGIFTGLGLFLIFNSHIIRLAGKYLNSEE